MRRAALVPLALLGLAACTTTDPAARQADGTCPLIRRAEMPLETHHNMLFVDAKIDDQPVRLLVDTGAERTLLTEATVDRLHLPRDQHHATRTFGIGSPTASWDAMLPNGIVFGTKRFPAETVTVGRFDINEVAGGGSVDGLLGADILSQFDVDLDLPAQRLIVYDARSECPFATPPWTEPYIGLKGIEAKRSRLLVPFELDGAAGMAVLDTGAQVSSVSRAMVERLGLGEGSLTADRTVMAHGAAPDEVAVHMHRFHEFRVASRVLNAPTMPVVPMTGGMGDALVGADFLHGRRVWLSFSTQRVFVTLPEHGPLIAATDDDQ